MTTAPQYGNTTEPGTADVPARPINLAQLKKLKRDSECLASRSNGASQTDLFYSRVDLYRHPHKGCFFIDVRGAALVQDGWPRFACEAEAREWLTETATCPYTGYGYTPEEVERIWAGDTAVRGSR